jgi:hypothetical protein
MCVQDDGKVKPSVVRKSRGCVYSVTVFDVLEYGEICWEHKKGLEIKNTSHILVI